ncbi:M12 family metallo-peptidase [Acanthopleuribacter pedis]
MQATAQSTETHVAAPNFELDAFSPAVNDVLVVHGLQLEADGEETSLVLERFLVFHPNARVVVATDQGEEISAPPEHAYYRGTVAGRPQTRVFMTVAESGDVRGLIADANQFWSLQWDQTRAQDPVIAATPLARESLAEMPPFECKADEIEAPVDLPGAPPMLHPEQLAIPAELLSARYMTTIAVETDHEFLSRLGGRQAALDYIGDLIGYTSLIYERELGTQTLVGDTFLWETSDDPWTAGNTGDQLHEFRDYWRANRTEVNRTLATFLSSRGLGGGVAWGSQLCSRSNGYSVSANLSGSFNFDNPRSVWDIVVVAHELGHNFGSGHTHCYNPPIDKCYDQCTNEDKTLPCDERGAGCGTILSYCHLLSGGMSNISLTMGLDHPHGDRPERVPAQMLGHVERVAAREPDCIPTTCNPPTIENQPASLSLCVGDQAELRVDATGLNLGYQWRKNGQPIDGATGAVLSLGTVSLDGAGTYYCVITSACGDLTTETAMVGVDAANVQVRPRLTAQGVRPVQLQAAFECMSGSTQWQWIDVTSNRVLASGSDAQITLPRLTETTVVELRVGEDGPNQRTAQARILVAADDAFEDVNGDGCSDIKDLRELIQDWRRQVARDPNNDGMIDLRDFLYINIDETCN